MFKTLNGSSIFALSNHISFSRTQTDATVPLKNVAPSGDSVKFWICCLGLVRA
jgi:hypothetical protein